MNPILQGSALWRALTPPPRSSISTESRSARRSFLRKLLAVRAQGIGGVRRNGSSLSSHTCRAFLSRRGHDGRLVTTQITSTAGGAGARERGAPQSPVFCRAVCRTIFPPEGVVRRPLNCGQIRLHGRRRSKKCAQILTYVTL
jgi:hypothetical protein